MSHTQGRLIADENCIGIAYVDASDDEQTNEANARRLVACWNLLLPFTAEEIEAGIDLEKLVRENAALKHELKAAEDFHVLALEERNAAWTKIAALKAESSQAQTIISELRVLIQNSLPADRNAPIWEMVKEFDRKYINKNSDSQNGAEE